MDEHGSGSSGFETIEDFQSVDGNSSDEDQDMDDSSSKDKGKSNNTDGFEEVVEKKRRR